MADKLQAYVEQINADRSMTQQSKDQVIEHIKAYAQQINPEKTTITPVKATGYAPLTNAPAKASIPPVSWGT